jgi:myosin heavy subunit
MIKGNDTNMLKKYNDNLGGSKSFRRPGRLDATKSFIVCHYAGDVEYEVGTFCEKNKDTVSDVINDTLF